MKLVLPLQLLSLILVCASAQAESILETEIIDVTHHVVSDPTLTDYFSPEQVTRLRKIDNIAAWDAKDGHSDIPYDPEPNSEWLHWAGNKLMSFDRDTASRSLFFVISSPHWNQIEQGFEKEALIFHHIAFSLKLEKNGEFDLTKKFYARRKTEWALHTDDIHSCELQLIETETSQLAQTIPLQFFLPNLISLPKDKKIEIQLIPPHSQPGKITYTLLQPEKKVKRVVLGNTYLSPYALFSHPFPQFEFALTDQYRTIVICK